MRSYHVALGRHQDLEAVDRDAAAGLCPRYATLTLARRLGAQVHTNAGLLPSTADRARSKVGGVPGHWALARSLAPKLGADDVIFCTGEDVGVPIAATLGGRRGGPKVVMFVHNLIRPRGKASLRLFGLARKVSLFVTNATAQVDFLRDYLRLPASRVALMLEQTDTRFFTPGTPSAGKTRPVVASVGLEQRDYHTLAEATRGLDVDVRISGFSRDVTVEAKAFPDPMPANMSRRFYPWPELVQLYRDADVVAVSVLDKPYTAGVTVAIEAWACRRPVVMTRTKGLADYLDDPGAAATVAPGRPDELRDAITSVLNDPARADALAEAGYRRALSRHNSENYVGRMADLLAGV
jgi:glycosyltransferase involved in cell wall biosynthesis